MRQFYVAIGDTISRFVRRTYGVQVADTVLVPLAEGAGGSAASSSGADVLTRFSKRGWSDVSYLVKDDDDGGSSEASGSVSDAGGSDDGTDAPPSKRRCVARLMSRLSDAPACGP